MNPIDPTRRVELRWVAGTARVREEQTAMGDLAAGVVILALLSLEFFRLGLYIARRRSRRFANCTASLVLVLTVCFAMAVHGKLVLAVFLRVSNVIVLGNWIPLGAALLAGVAVGERSGWPLARANLAVLLLVAAWSTVGADLLRRSPALDGPWSSNGVCMQTSPATCGPCSAVSLLYDCGIQATEREMTELCLTGGTGTAPLGIYRGLRLKTRGTSWRVEVVSGTLDDLRRCDQWPVLGLLRKQEEPSRAALPWLSRVGHTVVIYGFTDTGTLDVGDPGFGRSFWKAEELAARWEGTGIRLVPREAPSPGKP
ncbi:MAG: hypothetical protein GXY83_22095 [Rhodopirellula sp.]|nr:hypothetical protein [Rhodopirellula sp.]